MAAGTGNLILKRGVNMPYDSGQDGGGQETPPVLLQGMPAAQIIGSIWGLTAGNNAIVPGYAFDNYPNRLWIGTDRYAKDNTSYGGGNETFDDIGVSIEPYIGGSEPTHPDIHETRPIWMGAEIRAYTPLFEDTSDGSTGSSGSYVVLKADWDRPSDYVLATQKAISRMPLRYFSTVTVNPGGPTSPYTPYIEFSGWNGSTDGALARSTQYLFPSSNAPTAGHVLKINSVTAGTVPEAQIVKLEWASAGSATGTMSNFSIAGDTGTSQQVDDAETITFTGGTGIDTVAASPNTITFNLDLTELTTENTVAIGDFLAGVDATDNSSDKFTIGSVLGLLSSDVSVDTSTGAATVSATNVKAAATTDTTTFLALLENNSASAQQVKYDSDLAYNADTNTLSVTNVNATTITGTVSTATNANNINISATTSTDTATSIVLVGAQTAGNQSPFIDAGLTYNANTNTLTVSGGAVIGGDLTVNGTTTTINTTNLNVEDTIVTLNYGYAGSVPLDSGIEIERGSLSNVQMSWDESSKHWHAEIIDKNNVFSGGTTAKIGHYPLILADNTDPSTETKYANSPSGAPAGTQYVHTLDVKNLVMSGTWTLGASIQTDVNLSGGGLVLPYTTDVAAEENETQEGRVYWDTSLDLMTVGTGSVYKTMVDTDSTQTLSNKTLTTPKIVNDGYIADGNGNEQIIFKTTSSAVNEITITNAASGSSPLIASSGVNSNIDLRLQGKGTGTVVIDDSAINTTSTTFSVFNTTATSVSAFGAATSLTLGAVAAAATINIGTGNHPNGTKAINIGTGSNTNNTTTTVTIGSGTATLGATCSVLLGCPNAANTNVYVQSNRLVFGTTTSNRPVLSGAATTNSTVVHTLPNVNSGNVVIASTTNFNLSNYILMGGGSSSPSVYTNKDTVVVGGVKVNFQNSTPTNTRYPVPFLGSNRSTSTTAPSSFSTTTDGTYTDSYLYANLGNGTASGTPTNYTTGLFYEVNDSQDSTVGTLFCDYIGATLDCGTY